MFGYVTPLKCELRLREFDVYKAVYCGLCDCLQRRCGYFSKILLNYDFVFLSMIGISLSDSQPKIERTHCNTNPLKRCSMCRHPAAQTYSAAALCVSASCKLRDDIADEHGLKKLRAAVLLPTARAAEKRALRLYPELESDVILPLSRQTAAEKNAECTLDAAIDNTAASLAAILAHYARNDDELRILHRLGYVLGRFIYLADAADDLEQDVAKKRFNPLLRKFSITKGDSTKLANARKFARGEMMLAAAEVGDCYNLLDINNFKGILDNIVYLGLRHTADSVCSPERKGNKTND